MGPNFLIVGAAKSGTTSLYEYLIQHDAIFMPPDIKEPHYFCYKDREMSFRDADGKLLEINKRAVRDAKSYAQLFSGADSALARGEASAMYLYWPGTAAEIYKYNPSMKIVVALRHPVDRAYSAYNHLKRQGLEPASSFVRALELENERIEANCGPLWRYLALGNYSEQLSEYYTLFPKDQIKVVLFEDIVLRRKETLESLMLFLGVPIIEDIDSSGVANESLVPNERSRLQRLIAGENVVKKVVRRIVPRSTKDKLAVQVRKLFFQKPEKLDKQLRRNLYEERFAQTIRDTEKLIDRSLENWRN